MFEKPFTDIQEIISEIPRDERLELIAQIENKIPKNPQLIDYFRSHPNYTEKVQAFLESEFSYLLNESDVQVENRYVREFFEEILRALKDDSLISSTKKEDKEFMEILQDISQIIEDYDLLCKENEALERILYRDFNLNGDKFNNISVNRLIRKLYESDGTWQDIRGEIKIPVFDNEYLRLYQIIRNEDPLSTLGWRSEISSTIRDIVGDVGDEDYESDYDDIDESDIDQKIEEVFTSIDAYFDIKNVDARFIPQIIDLLYQSQELEKEDYGTFDNPRDEIDRRIHEYRDVGFRDILYRYIVTRLKPRLTTAFEVFKYETVMKAWANSDSNYSDGSEITVRGKALDGLLQESDANAAVESSHLHDRFSLALVLNKNCFAEYIADDAFYLIENVGPGNYQHTTIKDFLQSNGIGVSGISNDEIAEYRSLMDLRVRVSLEESFGFKILDLNPKEQYFFLNYLKRVTPSSMEVMKRFTSLYGVDGMRTFLSLERGDETLGDSIVAFGQHDEVAGTVFRYYSELLNSADRAEELVREVSACEGEACVALAQQVRENILNRAQGDLENAVRAHNPNEVVARIENYVAAAKEYVALLQEVGAGNIESVSPEMLSEGDRTRMQNLLQANYRKSYPDLNDTQFRDAVAASLTKSFKNPNTTFRILRDQDKIVSYNRFDTLRDYTGKEVSYFGSFNADPAYSGVGGVMLEETIKDRLEDGRPMMAYSDPSQPITKKYIEDGFVVTELHPFGGKTLFEIWRTKDSTGQFESKGKSIAELLTLVGNDMSVVVREQSDAETYPELQKGMGLTRYFNHEKKTYVVFEKLPDTLQGEFIPPQEEFKKAA